MTILFQQREHLIRHQFCRETIYLDGRRALYWPKEKTLIVADLHLGKARAFDEQGFNLPHQESAETLTRLAKLLTLYQPSTLIFLGDSFHREHSWQQLSLTDQQHFLELTQKTTECIWVLGNHDPSIPPELPGQRCLSIQRSNITLAHDSHTDTNPKILGHYHPKCRFRLGRKSQSGPCFILDRRHLILPAFGTFTGGLTLYDQAIQSFMQPSHAFLCQNDKIWALPRSTWRR